MQCGDDDDEEMLKFKSKINGNINKANAIKSLFFYKLQRRKIKMEHEKTSTSF
jgi:hypothetical protein